MIKLSNEAVKKPLNISFPGFFDRGMYLKNEIFNPSIENKVIKPIDEIAVVARPTSVEENSLAAIAQKINPKKLIISEFIIR